MEPLTSPKVWTDEELMALPDVGGKYELVHEELIVGPDGFVHDLVIMALAERMRRFVRERDLGYVAGSSLGCRMKNGNLRSPDVAFVAKERAKHLGLEAAAGFFPGAPDLAVEVLSPSDRISDLKRKTPEYFDNGCRLCWIIDPWHRTVLVVRPDGSEQDLAGDDMLSGEHVLQGFSLPVPLLFEDLDSLKDTPTA